MSPHDARDVAPLRSGVRQAPDAATVGARHVLSLIVTAREAQADGDAYYLEATLENAEVEQVRLVQLIEATAAMLNEELEVPRAA
jgi:hypothetical protein